MKKNGLSINGQFKNVAIIENHLSSLTPFIGDYLISPHIITS